MPSDWPSGVAVMAVHDASKGLSAEMMARLGQHAATVTAAAGQYQGQDAASAKPLGMDPKDFMQSMSQTASQLAQAGAQGFSQGSQGLLQGISQAGQAGASMANQLAQGGVSTTMNLLTNAPKLATATPKPPGARVETVAGTPSAAAPATADSTKDEDASRERAV